MSRSNDLELVNPCQRWLTWAGSEGRLRYYDKKVKENITIDLPFTFLVLDRLHTVAGFSDQHQCGFWANEVRDVARDVLTVRTKNGIVATGCWKQLPAITGLKYAQSIYVVFKDDAGQLCVGNLKASGAFVSAWIEFSKGRNIYEGAITITGAEKARKGATQYFTPVFRPTPVTEGTEATAQDLDIVLQEYLTAYLERSAQVGAVAEERDIVEEVAPLPVSVPVPPAPPAFDGAFTEEAWDEEEFDDIPF